MNPNNFGGISFYGAEVPAVLLSAGQTDVDVPAMRQEGFVSASTRNIQIRAHYLADLYGASMDDPLDREEVMAVAKTECAVGLGERVFEDALHLGPVTTRVAFGAMLQAEQDGLLPKETRQKVRSMLIEQGLVKRTIKERISYAVTYAWYGRDGASYRN